MAFSTDANAVIISTGRSSSIFDLVERRDAVHPRQHDVDDRGVERHRPQQVEPLVWRRRQADLVALAREERLEDLAHDLLIVDDENDAVGLSRGGYLLRERPFGSASGKTAR